MTLPADDPRHGQNKGYNAGCRQLCCRRAHARYKKDLRTRRYLLRVPALYLDSTGARRRIQALQVMGWRFVDIQEAMGAPGQTPARGGDTHVHNILRNRLIHLNTHERVCAAYRKLAVAPGPSRRGATRAIRKGWVGPFAWKDIDDPNEKPTIHSVSELPKARNEVDPVVVELLLAGRRVDSTRAEKDEAMRRWVLGRRGSRAALCRLHDWKEDRYWPVRFAVTTTGVTVDLNGVEDVAAAWPRPRPSLKGLAA